MSDADSYEDVEVEYIRGHNPDLVIFEDGVEVERIDLAPMTTDEIHALMKDKGFTRNEL